jgi:hypothetical protein
MMRDRAAWILTGATALTAMLCGHAGELALEAHHAFGGRLAPYTHAVQGPAAELALLGFAAAILMIAWRVVNLARGRMHQAAGLPALHSLACLHPLVLTARVTGIQLAALLAVESCEQHLSGFHGNVLASIAGPGHWTALAVHVFMGALFGRALWLFARYTAARTRQLVGAVTAFMRRLHADDRAGAICGAQLAPHPNPLRKPALLSLGLANRPPPISFAFSA